MKLKRKNLNLSRHGFIGVVDGKLITNLENVYIGAKFRSSEEVFSARFVDNT